jgi:prophage regulatory protein
MAERLVTLNDLPGFGITLSNCQLRRLEAAGQFPRRIRPTPRTFGWLVSEIELHIARAAAARNAVAA